MAAWQRPEYLKECLPNRVFRFRKQAQSKYHKVIITDEANLSTVLPTCYKSVTLLFVDNMSKTQLEQEIRELMIHIQKRCKHQKVVFLYTCGLSTMFSRYSLANTSNGTNCCSKCDLYLYNYTNDDLFATMTSLRGLISASMAMCYFLPTALPPFSIKWHVTQFQAEHQQCCPHAMQLLSASDISKSVRDEMQASLDEKLAQYNRLVNADCREKNLPVIDWSKTYLTNTNLNEREKNIMMKVTSLLCDFISVIYQDECSQELQQIQNALSASDDEVQVKEEPSDHQEESSPVQSITKDVSIKLECQEYSSKSPCTPRRSPRKLSSLKLAHQHTPEASNSLDDPNISRNDSPTGSNKRKLGSVEHSNRRSKKSNVSSTIFPASVPSTSASKESTLENKEPCQFASTSNEMELLEQESSTDESENKTASATKSNMKPSSISCGGKEAESLSDVMCNEKLKTTSAMPEDNITKSNDGDTEQDGIKELNSSSEVPSNNNDKSTDAHESSGSQEVLVINPTGRRKRNTDLQAPCIIQRADSSSDILILENNVAPSSRDVICLSNPSIVKFKKGECSKASSSLRRGNGKNISPIIRTSQRFSPKSITKSVNTPNDDLVVLEQDTSRRKAKQCNLPQNHLQNKTEKSTNVKAEPISSSPIELDHSPNNSVCMDISEEGGTGTAGDLTETVAQNTDGSCLASSMDTNNEIGIAIDSPKISDEDIEVGSITSMESIEGENKIPTIIGRQVQPRVLPTISLYNDESAGQTIVKSESITEEPVTPNAVQSSTETNARSVARYPSVTELPITPKIEQDSIEDVKPVLVGNGDFTTPGYVAIMHSPLSKRDRRQRNSSISSTSTEGSVQQPEFVESDVSVFKRTDAKGDALHILITDERLDAVTELLVSDLSYTNCMHICGHDTTIPQMNNSIKEALVETRKLKMNQSKHLIVAVCLGTVDIINLLGTLKTLPASCRKPKKVKYTTPEVVTLVYNRLVLLKRSIMELDQNARVILFKLPPTQVVGNVKIAIDQVNSLIHRCNRDDKTVSSGTQCPLRKLCKVSEPAFTLSNESTVQWLETCKFVISLVEKAIQEEKEAAAASQLKKTRAQKCLIDLEPPTTSCKKRLPFNEDGGRAKKVAKTDGNFEPEVVEEGRGKKVAKTDSSGNFEPEIVAEGNGKKVSRTNSPGNFEPEVVEEGSGKKVAKTDSSGNFEPEIVEEGSGKKVSRTNSPGNFEPEVVEEGSVEKVAKTDSPGNFEPEVVEEGIVKKVSTIPSPRSFEPEVVDVEEDRCKKKSVGSDASGKHSKTKKRSAKEVFINKHDNIVCITPGSIKTPVCRSSPRTPHSTVSDEPSSSSTTSSAPAPQFLPDDDPVTKQVNAYMRLLLRGDSKEQHEDEVPSGASSQLSSNVCALLAVSRVAFRSSTVDNEALLAAARRLQEHEQSANNRGSPSLEHVQKIAIIEAVGEAVQYLEDAAAVGQAAGDVLYAAVLNVKKVYAA